MKAPGRQDFYDYNISQILEGKMVLNIILKTSDVYMKFKIYLLSKLIDKTMD